jgi:zinc-ribbon family
MIIWGRKKQREGVGYAVRRCYRCGMTVHVVAEQKSKFTLYFIPVFTYSHKAFLFCTSCDGETELGGEEARDAIQGAMPRFLLESVIAEMQAEQIKNREDEIRALPAGKTKSKRGAAKAPVSKAKNSKTSASKPKKSTKKKT